jgi:hypothetical protein
MLQTKTLFLLKNDFLTRWLKVIIAVLSSLLIINCGPKFNVRVDSLARLDAVTKTSFILLSSDSKDSNDLQYIEFSGYIERALLQRGFKKAENIDSANIAIFLAYGIGDPKTETYTYNLPVYGQTGIASSNTTGRVSAYGNSASYSQTTENTPEYGVIGYSSNEGTYTVYTRHVFLKAYDLQEYRESKSERVLWETKMASTGQSGDLRLVFPVMVAAGHAYIGSNTGKIVDVSIYENDSRVQRVKGIAPPKQNSYTTPE